MFAHVFINRLKCLVRDRQTMFWTFVYPLMLAALFGLVFSNAGNAAMFKSIPIAVVNNAEYSSNTALQTALNSVSDANAQSENQLFHITPESREQADFDLENNNIAGYILLQNGTHVVVKESGLNQSILKQFMDAYLQTGSAYKTIIQSNPAAAANLKPADSRSYLTEVTAGKTPSNDFMISFYGLIGMSALFGGFWGRKQITDHQANLSPQGARINLAPVHKLKSLGYSLLAAVFIQFLSLLVLIAFMAFGLNIDFGNQLGYVLLTCLAGSVMGVSFGALIGATTKKSDHFKTMLLIAVSLMLSFLAGMMAMDVKYTVTHAAPIMAYINPANLISDAFYSLYFYSAYGRFFLSISILLGLSVVFYLIVYFITRRQKYASI